MSSRNKYLSREQRTQAVVLSKAIQLAQRAVRNSARPVTSARLLEHLKRFIEQQPEARVDYLQFFDPKTFEQAKIAARGTHFALAVRVGNTRLIDNARL